MKTTSTTSRSLAKRFTSSLMIAGMALCTQVQAVTEDQAKRIYERLTGNIPSEAMLAQMLPLDGYSAAALAIDNSEDHSFYNVTIKNLASPWTNRDFDIFADLNDYTATVVGFVRDSEDLSVTWDAAPSLYEPVSASTRRDFRGVLYENVLYVGKDGLGLPAYANTPNNNAHYIDLESRLELNSAGPGLSLKEDLEARVQSDVHTVLAAKEGAASGVVTSRAGARAFLIAGTNRAAFRFTMLNHLCLDMEQVHDVTRVPDRIRQDVSRSPGGDSRIFMNNCIGCHSGMDPMTQALAFHNYNYNVEADPTGEDGSVEYTLNTVQPKYFNNEATFPPGFITPDDRWANYWREGKNTVLGWDENLSGSGVGASSMFQELAHTEAFASCHVKRVFKNVCLRTPHDADDLTQVSDMVSQFLADGNMKHVFAASADYCKGN